MKVTKNNIYSNFSKYYDEYIRGYDYEKWFLYLKEISALDTLKNKDILDLGCGTGLLSILFALEKSKVVGVDLSEDMLRIADQNAFNNRCRIIFMLKDMKNFYIDKKFDFIYSSCDSINYLQSLDDFETLMKNVYKMLKDGAIFTFDIINKDNLSLRDEFEIDDTTITFHRKIKENFLKTNIEFKNKDSFFLEEHIQYLYKPLEITKICENIGFNTSVVEFMKDENSENNPPLKYQVILRK